MKKIIPIILLLVSYSSFGQVKISQLPSSSATNVDSLLFAIVDAGTTKKIKGYQLKALFLSGQIKNISAIPPVYIDSISPTEYEIRIDTAGLGSGSGTIIPNNEIAFGNGTGITSNSDFFYSTGSGGLFNVGFSGNVILQKTGNNYYFGDKDGINNQTYLHVNDGSKLVTIVADSLKLGSVKVALQATDSTSSPTNMIYQGTDGLLHKSTKPGLSAVSGIDSTTDTGLKIATAESVTKGTMTFFGDSWSTAYQIPNPSLRWTTLVANFLGYTENNAGLSSSTLMKRVTVDPFGATNMVDRIPLIPYHSTGDKIVFFLGLNDIRWNGANYTTANFVTDFSQILDSTITARGYSGSDITLMAPGYTPPTSYVSYGGNPAADSARHRAFDSCVNVLATTYGTRFYEVYDFMEDNGARALMQADSIHPNTHGHKVIALGFIQNFNEPVRFGNQKLAVNGLAEFNNIKVTNIPSTHSKKATELVLDENGYLAASTLRHLYYNGYGNVEIGDNADSIPYRLSVDGSGLINDGLNIYNKNATQYNKWLKLFSDYSTGNSLIDGYSPSGGAATLGLNTASKGNIKIGFVGVGATNPGGNIIDSFRVNIGQLVIKGFAPSSVEGLNQYFIPSTGSFISSYASPSTFLPLALQAYGGGVGVGTYTPHASAKLDITSTTQGFLPPRMTAAQAGAISSPAEGLMIYVTDTDVTFTQKGWWGFDGTNWINIR